MAKGDEGRSILDAPGMVPGASGVCAAAVRISIAEELLCGYGWGRRVLFGHGVVVTRQPTALKKKRKERALIPRLCGSAPGSCLPCRAGDICRRAPRPAFRAAPESRPRPAMHPSVVFDRGTQEAAIVVSHVVQLQAKHGARDQINNKQRSL